MPPSKTNAKKVAGNVSAPLRSLSSLSSAALQLSQLTLLR